MILYGLTPKQVETSENRTTSTSTPKMEEELLEESLESDSKDDEVLFSSSKSEISKQTKTGVTLTWNDLSVYIRRKENKFLGRSKFVYKRIVNNVSGAVQSGHLVAILGPSGAGKSTVLCSLGYRYHGGLLVDGDIRVNGRKMTKSIKHLSGYMHQEDLFIGALTVEEHLYFMAHLKMDRRTSYWERRKWVNDLISRLGLTNCRRNRIGGSDLDGEKLTISGGERKRLSFATECLTDPPLLFCDEPTTGLDSFTALSIVSLMRSMAETGNKAILCTIHQPSPEILTMFHEIILLADGYIVFFGPPEDALSFFQQQGYTKSERCSVGEFLVNTLAPTPGSERVTEQAVKLLSHQYALSDQAKSINMVINYQQQLAQDSGNSYFNYKAPFWPVKLFWMCYRSSLEVIRNPNVQWIRIFQKVLIAVMAGLCYFGSVSLTQSGVQAVQGALFILITENTFAPMYAVLSLFPLQFPLFIREYNNGTYSPLLFYITKIISTFPGLALEATVFSTIFYYLVGLRETFYAFMMITLITIICINVSSACGSMFSTAFESPSFAMAYLIPFDYAMMITSGLFIKLSSLPSVTGWIQYLSWLMYSYESMSIIQWMDVENITCAEEQPYLPCANSGLQVLENYSFSEDNFFRDVYAMIILYVSFHCIAFLFFVRKIRRS